jgi:hypothetical protein
MTNAEWVEAAIPDVITTRVVQAWVDKWARAEIMAVVPQMIIMEHREINGVETATAPVAKAVSALALVDAVRKALPAIAMRILPTPIVGNHANRMDQTLTKEILREEIQEMKIAGGNPNR